VAVMAELTWEQKLAALQCLADTSLRMRKPGDWFVNANDRFVCGNALQTGSFGNGKSPQEAVEDDWEKMTELSSGRYVQVRDGKRYRWNGFMWLDVTPDPAGVNATC
jgi:hypothetical protein